VKNMKVTTGRIIVGKPTLGVAESKPDTIGKCSVCYGYGMWAIGFSSPMGPIDAQDGCPTKPCPECGANANPPKVAEDYV